MGDFLLDLRREGERLSACPELALGRAIRVQSSAGAGYSLHWVPTGRQDLWGSWSGGVEGLQLTVLLAGVLALSEEEWRAVEAIGVGAGALGARALARRYASDPAGFDPPDGSYVAVVIDETAGVWRVVTDPAGVAPCFRVNTADGLVIGSHADVVAKFVGLDLDLDLPSLAEFLSTGVVSPPHCYYRLVEPLQSGSVYTSGLGEVSCRVDQRRYYEVRFRDATIAFPELVERLSNRLRDAVRRRSLPRLGRTAIALSGGLDSRSVLSCVHPDAEVVAFSSFETDNLELSLAREIAVASGVEFVPIQRDPEHYGRTAEEGVRVGGGLGDLASNHFLGLADALDALGAENLLTGCYFDYLFKALALNTRTKRFSRRQSMGPYAYESYLPHYALGSSYRDAVAERLAERFPVAVRHQRRELGALRTFPLSHEADNAMRATLWRTRQWHPPAADREVLRSYEEAPLSARLNQKLFRAVVLEVCPREVLAVTDANTLARVDAPRAWVAIQRYRLALRRALERRRRTAASAESWPSWEAYLRNSPVIAELWHRPAPTAIGILADLCGASMPTSIDTRTYRQAKWFLRLLTMKLWLSQRFEE